jgi:hypothetical protein
MKTGTVIVGFLTAVLGVLLLCFKSTRNPASQSEGAPGVSGEAAVEETPSESSVQPSGNPLSDSGIQWSEIQSQDFRVYVRNLRAIGCPEPTVRDIIIGLVNRKYRPRLAGIQRASSEPFWQTLERRSADQINAALDQNRARRELEAERNRLLRDLLGIEFEDYAAESALSSDRVSRLLDSVSESARPHARQILRKYADRETAVIQRCGGTLGIPERTELDQLYAQKIQELGSILRPQELEEFELRASPLAERLRTADLVGFSPTEEEFRQIFRVANTALQEGAEISATTGASQEDSTLRLVLGEKRFADYRRSQDLIFRQLVVFANQYGLDTEAAVQVHDMREAVLKRVDSVEEDSTLNDQGRLAALQTIHAEADQGVRELFGSETYEKYLSTHLGRWVNLIPTWTNGVVFRD